MSKLSNGTVVTDLHNASDNRRLRRLGYTVRLVETHHRIEGDVSSIHWDAPEITAADLPY